MQWFIHLCEVNVSDFLCHNFGEWGGMVHIGLIKTMDENVLPMDEIGALDELKSSIDPLERTLVHLHHKGWLGYMGESRDQCCLIHTLSHNTFHDLVFYESPLQFWMYACNVVQLFLLISKPTNWFDAF